MQDIFLRGILGALVPHPFPIDIFDEEHSHEQRLTSTESERRNGL
jgi:hypothetical protein